MALSAASAMPRCVPALLAFEIEAGSPLPDTELAKQRGGFATPDGLLLSFGVEQAVYVNGVLDASSSLSIRGGGEGPGGYQATLSGDNTLKVVQVGPAGSNILNAAKITSGLNGSFTVIQNTLNHQVITNTTIINASVANMGLFRDLNLSAAMRQQLINAVH
jgi:hypothetical protein